MKKIAILITLFTCGVFGTYAQPGKLDSTFGKNGVLINDIRISDQNYFNGMAVQKNGKIVAVGYTSYVDERRGPECLIARYNLDGTLDSSFSGDGIQIFFIDGTPDDLPNSSGQAVAIQADGKIVVACNTWIGGLLIRYNIDGSPDSAFNSVSPSLLAYINTILIQGDGKILAAGHYGNSLLARFNTDGTLDTTFSEDGIEITVLGSESDLRSIALQKDGKITGVSNAIINGAQHMVLTRYNQDGSLDNSFADNGKNITSISSPNSGSVAIQSDGKIVAGGGSIVSRYNANGSPDKIFAKLKTIEIDITNTLIQNDGKIIVAGRAINLVPYGATFGIARYNSDGNIDNTFTFKKTNDIATLNGAAISNNKLYASGNGFSNGGQASGVIRRYWLEEDNNSPSVSITSPARDTNFIVPGPILLKADASDSDGTIVAVDFYNDDSTLLFTDFTAPYSFQWYPVPTGNYHFTAVATDNKGGKDTSASRHIRILHNRAPVVKITSPADGAIFPVSAANILFTADAHAQGSVRTVDFYNGTVLMHTERKLPYTWNFEPSPGTYSITAKVTDSYERSNTSAAVKITVKATGEPLVSNRPSSPVIKRSINNFISIKLAPNPVRNILTINTTGLQKNKPSTISLVSATGVVIQTKQSNNLTPTIQLDMSSLSSGVYTIKLVSGVKVVYGKFVKL